MKIDHGLQLNAPESALAPKTPWHNFPPKLTPRQETIKLTTMIKNNKTQKQRAAEVFLSQKTCNVNLFRF